MYRKILSLRTKKYLQTHGLMHVIRFTSTHDKQMLITFFVKYDISIYHIYLLKFVAHSKYILKTKLRYGIFHQLKILQIIISMAIHTTQGY